ncbi:hypothetical protein MKX03_010767 [Papaver bracteatum]|nr:hypothetical protein MKX03_010767 [Papaver bracteatum]
MEVFGNFNSEQQFYLQNYSFLYSIKSLEKSQQKLIILQNLRKLIILYTLPCNFETIDLSSNRFDLPISTQSFLPYCNHLKFLDLSYNSFSGRLSNVNFGVCGNLKVLNLSYNHLTGYVPLSLRSCTQLQVLDLSANNFTGNLPSGFCESFNSSLEK